MPSDAAAALKDMERHIHLANQFVLGMDYTAFESDTRTVFAVIRCLEIISEASRRLPDTLKVRHPSIPRKDIAGDTVQLALPELQAVIAQEIRFADLASEEDRSHG